MNAMEFTARELGTGDEVTVVPMVAFDCDTTVDFYMVDEADRALWLGNNGGWVVDDEAGNYDYAECIEGISGATDEEVEASVNDRLAAYGFRLGDFDEGLGDRYFLTAL